LKKLIPFLIVTSIVITAVFCIILLNKWNIKKTTIESVRTYDGFTAKLNELYATSTDEFVLCLNGKIDNGIAVITSYHSPKEYKADENDIVFSSCSNFDFFEIFKKEKHLGTIHNHPSSVCHLGYMDCYSFGKSNDAIIGIICGEDTVHFFTPKDLINSLEINTI